ncbi:unnamed protein product, partial [Litomosoides sigmodontis]
MYTEIKELANFLALYMHNRFPGHQINLCMETFANYLAIRFYHIWYPDQPKYAENERFLAIKTHQSLDETLLAAAEYSGVDANDLYASLPPSIFIFCNPGEVTCRIPEYPFVITIWRGPLDADRYYTSASIGAAKYYDGILPNTQTTSLSTYASAAAASGSSGNMDVATPDRSVPLELVASAEIAINDFATSGFVDLKEIPPTLFCIKGSDRVEFTGRMLNCIHFRAQRLSSHHTVTYQNEHDAQLMNRNANGEAAAAPAPTFGIINNNQPQQQHQFAMSAEGCTANEPHVTNQYAAVATPVQSTNFSNTVNGNNAVPSQTVDLTNQPSPVRNGSDHFGPIFGTSSNLQPSVHSHATYNSTSQVATNFLPTSNSSTDCNFPRNFIASENSAQSLHGQSDTPESSWSYKACANDNASKNKYNIWKPIPSLTINNGNLTETIYAHNYIFDQPLSSASTESQKPVQSSSQSSFESEMNDLQQRLSNLSFLDTPPRQSQTQQPEPQEQPPQAFPPQTLPGVPQAYSSQQYSSDSYPSLSLHTSPQTSLSQAPLPQASDSYPSLSLHTSPQTSLSQAPL